MSVKNKGNKFERDICKQLSYWWTNGKSDDVFWRTSNSGGRATSRSKLNKTTRNAYGDISAIDPDGQPLIDLICLETKVGYNRDTVADLLDAPKRSAVQTYARWMGRVEKTADAADVPYWMVVSKRDKRDPICVMPGKLYNDLFRTKAKKEASYVFLMSKLNGDLAAFMVVRLDDFFALVSPDDVRKLWRKYKRRKDASKT